jgi:hypothetical protein
MAFRSALLRKALPFPRATHVHHDVWLGCVNALIDGKTLYITEPLVEYRRHPTTVTGRIKFSPIRRFQMRSQLLAALLLFYVRNLHEKEK